MALSQGEAESPAREAGIGDFLGGRGFTPARCGLQRGGAGRKMLFGDTRNVVSLYTTTKRRLRGPGKSSLPMFGAQGIVISFKDRTKRKGDAGKQHVGWRWACPYPTPAPCSAEWTWWGRQGSVAQAREWK